MQSMILVRIDTTKQATMLSIPRNLWLLIPNMGYGKISTAYQFGGAQAVIGAVESNFKVHVDDYGHESRHGRLLPFGPPT